MSLTVRRQQPTFSIQAYNGGAFRVALFNGPTVIDLSGLVSRDDIAILLNHTPSMIVGQASQVQIGRGVQVDGIVTGNWEDRKDPAGQVVQHAKRGFKWKASVGIDVERVDELPPGNTLEINGRTFAGPLYVVRAGVLAEVSFVTFGADRTTSAKVAAAVAKASARPRLISAGPTSASWPGLGPKTHQQHPY